jgi:hypothetical protein
VTVLLKTLALALVLVGLSGAGAVGAYMMSDGIGLGHGGWGHMMGDGDSSACGMDQNGWAGCDADGRGNCPVYGDGDGGDVAECDGSPSDCEGEPRGCAGAGGGCW